MTTTSSGAAPTVRDARARYFAANGFDERGYGRELRLDRGVDPARFSDAAAFVGWSGIAVLTFATTVAVTVVPLAAIVTLLLR